jgi:hypothetical protein
MKSNTSRPFSDYNLLPFSPIKGSHQQPPPLQQQYLPLSSSVGGPAASSALSAAGGDSSSRCESEGLSQASSGVTPRHGHTLHLLKEKMTRIKDFMSSANHSIATASSSHQLFSPSKHITIHEDKNSVIFAEGDSALPLPPLLKRPPRISTANTGSGSSSSSYRRQLLPSEGSDDSDSSDGGGSYKTEDMRAIDHFVQDMASNDYQGYNDHEGDEEVVYLSEQQEQQQQQQQQQEVIITEGEGWNSSSSSSVDKSTIASAMMIDDHDNNNDDHEQSPPDADIPQASNNSTSSSMNHKPLQQQSALIITCYTLEDFHKQVKLLRRQSHECLQSLLGALLPRARAHTLLITRVLSWMDFCYFLR